jgi:hypothetical protein
MKKIISLMAVIVIFCPLVAAKAAYTSTSVSADADVKSQFPTTNFGAGSHNYVFRLTSGNRGRLFLKFPLPQIPAGSTINQGYVMVQSYTDECFSTTTFYIAAPTADWSESTINWNNQPATSSPSTVIFPCQANAWFALPAKEIIAGMMAGSRPNYGFAIYGDESSGNWQRSIYTDEYGYSGKAYFYIDYTPPVADQGAGQTTGGSTTGSQNSSTSTSGTNSTTSTNHTAPAKVTSKTIAPVSNLRLEPVIGQDQTLVNLTWDASATSDIDGYKVYRSENNLDFLSLGQSDKSTVTFTDTPEKEKTFYYKVRAYKGSDESADSNIVSFLPEVTATPTPEVNPTLKTKVLDFLKSTKGKIIVGGGVLLLLAAIIATVLIVRKKRVKSRPVGEAIPL